MNVGLFIYGIYTYIDVYIYIYLILRFYSSSSTLYCEKLCGDNQTELWNTTVHIKCIAHGSL